MGEFAHMLDVVDETVSSGLGADEASSPVLALACEHTDELVGELLVSSKHESNLAATGSDITSYKEAIGSVRSMRKY